MVTVNKPKKKRQPETDQQKQARLQPKLDRPTPIKSGDPTPPARTKAVGGEPVRTFSRPTGTPVSRNIETTGLPQEQQQAISETSGREGIQTPRVEEGVEFLKEREFFEERIPENVELDIPKGTGEGLPVFGSAVGALKETNALGIAARTGILGGMPPETQPLMDNPETLRELAIQQIQKQTIQNGISAGERFGAVIEAIPVVGSLANKYANGLIETPSANVDTILSNINSERERASVLAESVANGKFGDPEDAVERIEDIELNIARLEQRIKLLSLTSAQLRADADQLNKIEEKILRSKERVFIAKQQAARGLVVTPTDSNLFLTLQDLKGG